jgi:hypothetical protein
VAERQRAKLGLIAAVLADKDEATIGAANDIIAPLSIAPQFSYDRLLIYERFICLKWLLRSLLPALAQDHAILAKAIVAQAGE